MHSTLRDNAAAVAAIVGLILLIAIVLIASYLGGWWIFADSTRREGEIRRQTFEFQQGRVDSAENQIADIRRIDTQLATDVSPDVATGLRNQRAAIVAQTCKAINEIPGHVPDDLATFRAQECNR